MSGDTKLSISCLCGTAKQAVELRNTESGPLDIDICHSYDSRYSSGLLYVSYAPIRVPSSLDGLVEYPDESAQSSADTLRRYFCGTCGCHVFRRSAVDDGKDSTSWEVATGTIIGRVGADEVEVNGKEPLLRYARHINTDDTKDGGLSPFINIGEETRSTKRDQININTSRNAEDVLKAHCHCKAVSFQITRPDTSSRLLRSNFPDLTHPYATTPQEIVPNPHDEKWWLRPRGKDDPDLTRYLAGTCACRSCRLSSGFEIQTWAFVPRSNIFFLPPSSPTPIPLDFSMLQRPPSPLRSYESTPGVLREFCPRCGASVFWHDRWRPELIDVSVGLLAAEEGARAESWLDWWKGRVSFEEDVGNGRSGVLTGEYVFSYDISSSW
ncbi:Mss4-like protein [Daldinia sp. FL1419]|nr:Mss4-like protein [Daldinia sp. FL1419]